MGKKLLRSIVVSLGVSFVSVVISQVLGGAELVYSKELVESVLSEIGLFFSPVLVGCVLVMLWQTGNRYNKIGKSVVIALVVGILTAVINMLGSVESVSMDNLLSLHSSMLVMESVMFTVPVFIGCVLFTKWQVKADDAKLF